MVANIFLTTPAPPGGWQEGVTYTIMGLQVVYPSGLAPEQIGLTSPLAPMLPHQVQTGTPAPAPYAIAGVPAVTSGFGSALALLGKIPGLPTWLTGALGVGAV